jgi:hypothetical protein
MVDLEKLERLREQAARDSAVRLDLSMRRQSVVARAAQLRANIRASVRILRAQDLGDQFIDLGIQLRRPNADGRDALLDRRARVRDELVRRSRSPNEPASKVTVVENQLAELEHAESEVARLEQALNEISERVAVHQTLVPQLELHAQRHTEWSADGRRTLRGEPRGPTIVENRRA